MYALYGQNLHPTMISPGYLAGVARLDFAAAILATELFVTLAT